MGVADDDLAEGYTILDRQMRLTCSRRVLMQEIVKRIKVKETQGRRLMLASISLVAEVLGIAILLGYLYATIQGARRPLKQAEGS